MKNLCLESVMLFERLRRLFMTTVKRALSQMLIADITPTQAMILYGMGHNTLKVTDIIHSAFCSSGSGSNVFYNVKKMIANQYITKKQIPGDRRVVHVSLSQKGKDLYEKIEELLEAHLRLLAESGINEGNMEEILGGCQRLETAWQQCFL